ncbi:hypothetical protein Srufu_052640 [Streptomyces libani subsp. rufus]|nr:hypothetical protein Srufu_052640 [Streptomyces libani subsp. rufus]
MDGRAVTAMHDRALDEYFAEFEPPEGLRAELLRREILLTGGTDIVHNRIVSDVTAQIPHDRWHRFATSRWFPCAAPTATMA